MDFLDSQNLGDPLFNKNPTTYMALLNSLISWFTIKRMEQIELFKKYPLEVQRDMFFHLITSAKNTEWGKMHDYASIKTMREYKERVPVREYDAIKPFIERIRKGEKNVMWDGEIKWFAQSSGTTSDKSKYIPVSKEAINDCHYRGGRDVLAIYNSIHPNTQVFKGKGLIIGGSQQINSYNNDLYYGDLSAVLLENLPLWVHILRVPNKSIALMDEWERKIELMAKSTINENVTNISGVPSWTLVLIKKIFALTGKNNLREIWPNLELFIHGGVSFKPYREQFKNVIPSDRMNYLETYNASEGFFSIQEVPSRDDMLLMLDYGIYYEFVPIEEIDKEFPKAVSLEDVETGKNYAIVISTNSGLWRYMIGDTIEFTSKFPFKIRITGRTRHFINAFGEEVIVDNADFSIKIASERTNASVREYTAAPVYMQQNSKGGHQWIIEFDKQPDDIEHFAEILDSTLKSVNSDYEAKRYKNLSLDKPIVQVAKEGLFYSWLKEKDKLGGQHKIPRLANHRKYIEELVELNATL